MWTYWRWDDGSGPVYRTDHPAFDATTYQRWEDKAKKWISLPVPNSVWNFLHGEGGAGIVRATEAEVVAFDRKTHGPFDAVCEYIESGQFERDSADDVNAYRAALVQMGYPADFKPDRPPGSNPLQGGTQDAEGRLRADAREKSRPPDGPHPHRRGRGPRRVPKR